MITVDNVKRGVNPRSFQPEIQFTASIPLEIFNPNAVKLTVKEMNEHLGNALYKELTKHFANGKGLSND